MPHRLSPLKKAILVASMIMLTGCTLPWQGEATEPLSDVPEPIELPTGDMAVNEKPVVAPKEEQKKIMAEKSDNDLSKQNQAERVGLLTKKAEFLSANNEYTEALQLYERILKLSPSSTIEHSAAYAAFQSKDFEKAIQYYKKNGRSLALGEKELLLKSMRYIRDPDFLETLEQLQLPDYISEAYKLSWTCEYEYISCEKSIISYRYDYPQVTALKEALKTYESIGQKSISFKEALLIAEWYKNADYSTVLSVGQNLLKQKSDYRPVLKIVGFSAYMTNQYSLAQVYLTRYKKLEPKDPEIDFLLGLILFAKGDYETSSVYFNQAILGGYKPKINVERKLAYNYWLLGKMKNMFQVLSYLVKNDTATESDLTNALYLALNEKEYQNTQTWIQIGETKFPNSDEIQAMKVWYLRATGSTTEAQSLAETLLKKNPDNLIALIQSGIIAYESGDTAAGLRKLQKAKMIDVDGNWSTTIDEYLGKTISETKETSAPTNTQNF